MSHYVTFVNSYPLSEGVIWRPFTKSNKNHLLYNKGVFSEGNVYSWKYQRLEMFWNSLLPQLSTNYTRLTQRDRHIMCMYIFYYLFISHFLTLSICAFQLYFNLVYLRCMYPWDFKYSID